MNWRSGCSYKALRSCWRDAPGRGGWNSGVGVNEGLQVVLTGAFVLGVVIWTLYNLADTWVRIVVARDEGIDRAAASSVPMEAQDVFGVGFAGLFGVFSLAVPALALGGRFVFARLVSVIGVALLGALANREVNRLRR